VRPALSLPRLEIRRERPVRDLPRSRGVEHAPGDQASLIRQSSGRRRVIYMGPPELRPAPPELEWVRVSPSGASFQAPAGIELPPGDRGGIDSSHVSFLHSGELETDRSQGQPRQRIHLKDRMPVFEVVDFDGAFSSGRAATPTTALLLENHAVDHALAYDHSAAGGAPYRSARLVPIDDEHCGLEHQLSPGPGAKRVRTEGYERRRGDPREVRSGTFVRSPTSRTTTCSTARCRARPLL